MAQIKDKPVAFGYRPFIKCLFAQHAKKIVGSAACLDEANVMIVAGLNCAGNCSHGLFPSL
jgi:hypothetical protein